ncbi:MAG: hypothetical protein HWE30_19455 [Methylocystaceae bacterium]|nr:hypothetical protein [Methylocystaceae bacterium]
MKAKKPLSKEMAQRHLEALIDGSAIWFPQNAFFRRRFNEIAKSKLEHFLKHGDGRTLQNYINTLPDVKVKVIVADYFLNFAPITYDKNFLFRKFRDGDDIKRPRIKAFSQFDLFGGSRLSKEYIVNFDEASDTIGIKQKQMNQREFVQFILDSITENRRIFEEEDVEELSYIVERLKAGRKAVKTS